MNHQILSRISKLHRVGRHLTSVAALLLLPASAAIAQDTVPLGTDGLGYIASATPTPEGKSQALRSLDETPEGLTNSDWHSIRAAYEAGRHAFLPVEGKDGHWQARNPGQQWTTHFDGRGFIAQPKGAGWQWGLELQSYGFGDQQTRIQGKPAVKTAGQRLSYQWDATVQEWFVNDQRGLEHGFTVKERPVKVSNPNSQFPNPLSFTLTTRGGLNPHITAGSVQFQDASGTTVLNYSGLKVWDADGTILPARFEPAGSAGFRLLVDEAAARYPITIDPIAQQAYLKASNTEASDQFGGSVAISGDTAVVGAPFEDSSTTGVNSTPNELALEAGAAYVFVRSGSTWTQQAYLKAAQVTVGDNFGSSVAVSGDTVVIGAVLEDSNTTGINGTPNESGPNTGAAYVFVRSGGTWSQQAYLKASHQTPDDQFGGAVAISGDTVIVGAVSEDSSTTGVNSAPNEGAITSGAAFVFVRSGSTWSQQAYLKASNTGAVDQFGVSVAASGDTVVVGAFLEDSSTTGINSTPNDSASAAGAAYVFVRSGSTWSQQAYLKAAQVTATDIFGISVAISGDTVVVGASLEDSSTTGINSTPNEAAADAGAAYVFVRSGSTWSQQAYLKAAQVTGADYFGTSVAVSGNVLVVGSKFEDSSTTGIHSTPNESAADSGAAYVFVRSGSTWTQDVYLKAAQVTANDEFGTAVAASGDTVIVGGVNEDSSTTGVNSTPNELASGSGAAYTFTGLGPVVAAPTVASIAPASGSTAGGTSVTITGTDFTGATGVTIGGAAATSLNVVSPTSITCTTPAGTAGTASVVVTTPGGGNAANTLFTYNPPIPTLSAVNPRVGPPAGGTSVTLTGTNFTGAMGVTFGGATATSVDVVNDTTITCVTPAGTVGTTSVIITTPSGTNTANTRFIYTGAPTITAGAAQEVGAYSAIPSAPLSTNGLETTIYIELGTTTAYGTTLPVPGSPLHPLSSSAQPYGLATGLIPGTLYHYRLVATNSAGTTVGDDQTFTTDVASSVKTWSTAPSDGEPSSETNSWNRVANWVEGATPTTSQDALLNQTGAYPVTRNASSTGRSFHVSAGTVTLDVTGTATIFTSPSAINGANVILRGSGSIRAFGGLTVVNGSLDWQSSTTDTSSTVGSYVGNGGLVTVQAGRTFNFNGTMVDSGGRFVLRGAFASSAHPLHVMPGGLLTGDGSVKGRDLLNRGVVSPDSANGPTGIISVGIGGDAKYVQIAEGELIMDLGGTTQGTGYDAIRSANSTFTSPRVAGKLTVRFSGGFIPAPGDVFSIVDNAVGITGTFDTVVWPAGYTGTVLYNGTSVQLTSISPLAPEINVRGNSTNIVDGSTTPSNTDHTQFLSTLIAASSTRVFTIQNTGSATLNMSGITFSGTHAADFSLTTSAPTSVSAGSSVNITAQFSPSAVGTRTATLNIASDDSDEGTYTFAIQGTGANNFPTISKSPFGNETVNEDTSTATLTFTVGDVETPANSLIMIAAPSDTTLVPVANVVFGGSGATRTAVITPAANLSGTTTVSIYVEDQFGSRGGSAFSLTVNPVNDVPSFTKGADQSHPNGTNTAQSITSWAAALRTGPANESTQTLSFNVTEVGSSGIFTTPPAIASNGTLTYTPNGTGGTATFSVTVQDNGGIANGGVDTSAAQTFTITVDAAPDYAITTAAGVLTITDNSGLSEGLTFRNQGTGFFLFQAGAASTFSLNGAANTTANSGSISSTGITRVVINAGGGNNSIQIGPFVDTLPSLEVNGGAGDDTVTLNTATFVSGANLTVNLNDDGPTPGSDGLTLAGGASVATTGTGAIFLDVSRYISFPSGVSLRSASGDITLRANQQAIPTTVGSGGVSIGGFETKVESTAGNVFIYGKSGSDGPGVAINQEARVSGMTTTIVGEGMGTGNSQGVLIQHAGTLVTSAGGLVSITGIGSSAAGTDVQRYGIFLEAATISAGGTGGITLHGTGGNSEGASVWNTGVRIVGTAATDAIISGNGPITITGVHTTADDIAFNPGIVGNSRITGNSPSVTFMGDRLVNNISRAFITTSPSGTVTFKPRTAGTAIQTGGGAVGTFYVTDNFLDNVSTGNLVIGSSTAGNITVNQAISRPAATNITFLTGVDVLINQPIDSAGGTVLLDCGETPAAIKPKATPLDITASTLSFGSDLSFNIAGTTVNTQYDQLSVVGAVDITGDSLILTGAYVPLPGNSFIIIDNDGTDPIIGTFTGLAEGSTVMFNGVSVQLTYVGGTGNDVVLSLPTVPALAVYNGPADTDPLLEDGVSPAVDFGNVIAGASADKTFLIKNTGTGTLNITSVTLPARYSLVGFTPQTLAANSTYALVVRYSPNLFGTTNAGDAVISTNAGSGTFTFSVTGVGAAPEVNISVTPSTVLEDGAANLVYTFTRTGPTSAEQEVKFEVSGTAEIANDYTVSVSVSEFGIGTIIIPAGQSSATVTVNPTPDMVFEADETVILTIGESPGIFAGDDDTATGTITNDDVANTAPTDIALAPSSLPENNTTNATVGTLTTTDADAENSHTYSLVAGAGSDDNASFSIVGNELKLMPSADFETKSTYNVRINTNDGTANFEKAFVVTITNVNEIPSFTKGPDQLHPANTMGAQVVSSWASGFNDGDSTVTQVLTLNVSNNNNGIFSVQPSINLANGTLTYTLNGTAGTATVSVSLTDDNSINSKPALTSVVQTFTIGIAAGPEITVTGNAISISNNDTTPSAADHTLFTAVAAASIEDTRRVFTIRNVGTADLTLSTVALSGAHVDQFLVITQPGASLAPAAQVTFSVAFLPSSLGVKNATVSFATNDSDENPFTFAISGEGLNTAPTDIALSNAELPENNAANATVGTLSTTDDDSGQTFVYSLVSGAGSDDNAQFTIAGNELKLTPSANFEDKAIYNIRINTNDGTANFEKAFVVTITNVNEVPSFTKGGNQDHPPFTNTAQTVPSWATALSDGDGTGQSLTFIVTNDNNDLFTTQPAVSPTGELTYTPNGSAGSAIVSVSIRDDDSINHTPALTSAAKTFTITVSAGPEMDVRNGPVSIANGDTTPAVADSTDFGGHYTTLAASTRSFAIHNTGTGPLALSGNPVVAISGPHAAEFTVTLQPATTLAAGHNSAFQIAFKPTTFGLRTATVTIANDDPDENPYTFTIQGTGLAPNIAVTGNSVSITKGDTTPDLADHTDFGGVAAASGSIVRTFTIQNNGTSDLEISSASTTGINSKDFTVTTQPTSPVVSGGSATFVVTFDPSARGVRNTTIRIDSGDPDDSPFNFSITGSGLNSVPTDIALSPASINENNASGATVGNLTSTDDDAEDTTFTYTLVAGTGSDDNASFQIRNGNEVAINLISDYETKNSYTIRVRTDDGDGGTFEKPLVITINDVNEAPTITSIAIQGTAAGTATSALPFTIGDPETAATELTVTFTSSNQALVPDGNITLGGSAAARTVQLAPVAGQNGTTTIQLTVSDGSLTASTTFTLSVTGDPIIAVYNGPTATDPALVDGQSASVDFGTPFIGVSVTKNFLVKNNGPVSLSLTGLTVPAGYSLTTPFAAQSLAPAGTYAFSIRFTPTLAASPVAGIVQISSNDPNTAVFDFPITGNGQAPAANITVAPSAVLEDGPSSLLFTVTRTGPTTAAQEVNYAISGTATTDTDYVFSGIELNFDNTFGRVTIPAGQASASFSADPTPDASPEPDETIILTFSESPDGITAGTSPSATGIITNTSVPEISVTHQAVPVRELLDGTLTPVDFGSYRTPVVLSEDFIITNSGSAELIISQLTVPLGFVLESTPLFPVSLAPGGQLDFTIQASISTKTTASGNVVITSNDADEASFDFPITATHLNAVPIANNQNVTTAEATAKPITLTGSDLDEDPLEFNIVTPPAHGSLTGTGANRIYTPTGSYNGPDSFTYKVNDGNADSNIATISITVTSENGGPTLSGTLPNVIHIKPGVSSDIPLTAFFNDDETPAADLIYTVTASTGGAYFTSSLTSGTLSLTGTVPGQGDLTVRATDPQGLFAEATFTYTVKHVPTVVGAGLPDMRQLPTNIPACTGPVAVGEITVRMLDYFTDADADTLTTVLVTNSNPAAVSTTSTTPNVLNLAPLAAGISDITIQATDTDGNIVTDTFRVQVGTDVPCLTQSALALNRQTGLLEMRVTVTNTTGLPITGFRLIAPGLPADSYLYNNTGPAGARANHMDVPTALANGASATVVMEFYSPTRTLTTPTIQVELKSDAGHVPSGGAGVAVTRIIGLADGVLVEFNATSGQQYRVEYSTNLTNWSICPVTIKAGGNRVQWIDRGPPYTDVSPLTQPRRYYRVRKL